MRAAYAREAERVARPVRVMGLVLALVAAALAGVRACWWPELPRAVPLLIAAAALLHLLAAVAIRVRAPRGVRRARR